MVSTGCTTPALWGRHVSPHTEDRFVLQSSFSTVIRWFCFEELDRDLFDDSRERHTLLFVACCGAAAGEINQLI